MKMFVWDDVLWDYSNGMIVVLAETLEQARAIACENWNHPNGKDVQDDINTMVPDIYETPSMVYLNGGA